MNIAFIPVRGGSKSIPLKNIKILNKKPLIYWTAKAANDCVSIDKVVIATDSDEIENTVLALNLPKIEIYRRNPINAQDASSTESVMLEYINFANLDNDSNFFLIQATSPMLRSEQIDGMYEYFKSIDADSIFSGVREKQFHWQINEGYASPVNYDYKNRPRRQDFEGLIAENGACYINSVKNIKQNKCRLSGKVAYYELPAYTAYEIDEEEDWVIVENLMKNYKY